ncbi:hypothetical protein ABZZ74_48675 [Streptomyces sp. NPDC006476]|uniref:hypothetical protein n=1 Tax=Streptomyces sp. NPDC006476 TaxID=3157175 RepID=UPI0033A61A2A
MRAWQARLEAAPAVHEFLAGSRDDSEGVDLADALDVPPVSDTPWCPRTRVRALARFS